MAVFTTTWNAAFEAAPADTDNISQGATKIRELKQATQERLVENHSWAGDADDGKHKDVVMMETTLPTTAANELAVYSKDNGTEQRLYWGAESAGSEHQFADLDSTETLTNKTLTSPTLTNPTVNNGTLNTVTLETPTVSSPTFSGVFNADTWPRFSVHTVADTAIAINTYVQLVFTTKDLDSGDDVVSNDFIVPVTGSYVFSSQCAFVCSFASIGRPIIQYILYRDGDTHRQISVESAVTDAFSQVITTGFTFELDATAGEVFTVITHISGFATGGSALQRQANFSGHRIG